MTHIPIQAIGNYNTLWFWYMVPEPHGCLYIEIYYLIILFQVTIYFQYVHDYFNVHLRCCVLCHYYMFYGRLRFYCILIVYAKFFMFTLFLLYLVRNDNNKDDQSVIAEAHSVQAARWYGSPSLRCSETTRRLHSRKDKVLWVFFAAIWMCVDHSRCSLTVASRYFCLRSSQVCE